MALEAYKWAKLDEIWLMPSNETPNKLGKKMASSNHRINMCKLASENYPFMKVSDYEIKKKGISYTYLTITDLVNQYPNNQFYFIMGADSINYFENWVHPEIIASNCIILVINRNQFTEEYLYEKAKYLKDIINATVEIINCPKVNISSTEIRKNSNNYAFCKDYISEKVFEYMKENSLYSIEE